MLWHYYLGATFYYYTGYTTFSKQLDNLPLTILTPLWPKHLHLIRNLEDSETFVYCLSPWINVSKVSLYYNHSLYLLLNFGNWMVGSLTLLKLSDIRQKQSLRLNDCFCFHTNANCTLTDLSFLSLSGIWYPARRTVYFMKNFFCKNLFLLQINNYKCTCYAKYRQFFYLVQRSYL